MYYHPRPQTGSGWPGLAIVILIVVPVLAVLAAGVYGPEAFARAREKELQTQQTLELQAQQIAEAQAISQARTTLEIEQMRTTAEAEAQRAAQAFAAEEARKAQTWQLENALKVIGVVGVVGALLIAATAWGLAQVHQARRRLLARPSNTAFSKRAEHEVLAKMNAELQALRKQITALEAARLMASLPKQGSNNGNLPVAEGVPQPRTSK